MFKKFSLLLTHFSFFLCNDLSIYDRRQYRRTWVIRPRFWGAWGRRTAAPTPPTMQQWRKGRGMMGEGGAVPEPP